jgi:peptidylprolyl isomerase
VGVQAGGRRQLVIPPDLGYGAEASGDIPPNSTLVFVIDVLSVEKAEVPGG